MSNAVPAYDADWATEIKAAHAVPDMVDEASVLLAADKTSDLSSDPATQEWASLASHVVTEARRATPHLSLLSAPGNELRDEIKAAHAAAPGSREQVLCVNCWEGLHPVCQGRATHRCQCPEEGCWSSRVSAEAHRG